MKTTVKVTAKIDVLIESNFADECQLDQVYRDATREATKVLSGIMERERVIIGNVQIDDIKLEVRNL